MQKKISIGSVIQVIVCIALIIMVIKLIPMAIELEKARVARLSESEEHEIEQQDSEPALEDEQDSELTLGDTSNNAIRAITTYRDYISMTETLGENQIKRYEEMIKNTYDYNWVEMTIIKKEALLLRLDLKLDIGEMKAEYANELDDPIPSGIKNELVQELIDSRNNQEEGFATIQDMYINGTFYEYLMEIKNVRG